MEQFALNSFIVYFASCGNTRIWLFYRTQIEMFYRKSRLLSSCWDQDSSSGKKNKELKYSIQFMHYIWNLAKFARQCRHKPHSLHFSSLWNVTVSAVEQSQVCLANKHMMTSCKFRLEENWTLRMTNSLRGLYNKSYGTRTWRKKSIAMIVSCINCIMDILHLHLVI